MKERKKSPLTFGAILFNIEESCQSLVFSGIYDFAVKKNINILTFISSSQRHFHKIHYHFNIIAPFINKNHMDGVIYLTGPMLDRLPNDEVKSYILRNDGIPKVNVFIPLGNIPTVMIDNKTGIYQAIDHLVQKHNYRKIAFIKGPENHEEAIFRFEAYREGLARNNIPYNPAFVYPGNYTREGGIAAADAIMRKKMHVDAIIAVDDETAIAAIERFQAEGKSVPGDIAVIGFDNVEKADYLTPPLTTIKQPLYQQGYKACESLWHMTNGELVQKKIYLPTQLIIRESCGCLPNPEKIVGDFIMTKSKCTDYTLIADKEKIRTDIFDQIHQINHTETSIKDTIEKLYRIIIRNTETIPIHDFLNVLNRSIQNSLVKNNNAPYWEEILIVFFKNIMRLSRNKDHCQRYKDLYWLSRTLLANLIVKKSSYLHIEKDWQKLQNQEIGQLIISTFSIKDLLAVLEAKMSSLKIRSLYVVLYNEKSYNTGKWSLPETSQLIFGYKNMKSLLKKGEQREFKTLDLLPVDLFSKKQMGMYIFLALHSLDDQYGYLIVELNNKEQVTIIESLRIYISSSIRSSLLVNELLEKNIILEQLSMNDEMTGLYNRRGFFTMGEQYIRRIKNPHQKFHIFIADMDGLKIINDTYGHKEGDYAIKSAAMILTNVFTSDDIVARIGGDEFTILVKSPSCNIKGVRKKLIQELKRFNKTSEKPYEISLSIGASEYSPDRLVSLADALNEADRRLYNMKKLRKTSRRK